MRILLASSSNVSFEIFNSLISLSKTKNDDSKIEIAGFLTNSDQPTGRGQKSVSNEFAEWAIQFDLPIYKISKSSDITAALNSEGADLVITVAFGKLVSKDNLDIPKFGWLNVHFSLLPKYRGAAPVQHAILNGDLETGVSIFKLDEGLDTGPIFAQSKYEIPRMATTKLVLQELARLSIKPLVSTISAISKGEKGKAQSELGNQISTAPKINKSDGHLIFDQPISNIINRFLALCDNPGVYATVNGTRIKFENLEFEQVLVGNSEIAQIQNKNSEMQIIARDGIVTVKQLRPEGKSSMTGAEFLRGRPNLIGQIVN